MILDKGRYNIWKINTRHQFVTVKMETTRDQECYLNPLKNPFPYSRLDPRSKHLKDDVI